jgi:hypothetical protein
MTESIKAAGTIIVTALVVLFVILWGLAVWQTLGKPPQYLPDGKTIQMDEFARAKDILILILPLLTTAVGYWLGSQGTAQAEVKAKQAEAKKDAVLSVSPPNMLAEAQKQHPDAFN